MHRQRQPWLPCRTAEKVMGKKPERAAKPGKPSKGDRWTVRGVPARLQKGAGDAARARGLTLGQWLSEVVDAALAARPRRPAEMAEPWEQMVERRLARLEAAVLKEAPERFESGEVAAMGPN